MEISAERSCRMLNPFYKVVLVMSMVGLVSLPNNAQADEAPRQPPSIQESSSQVIGREIATISVIMDFAKLLSFDQPARTIVIGNPGIVDGTLSDENTIVLTGKAVGTTNMIILGEGGREIANLTVDVARNNSQLTVVNHGATQQIFSCAGRCQPVAAPAVGK
jgi:Flp pilus assembly secretin CpaC